LRPKGSARSRRAVAEHKRDVQVEVEVSQAQAGELGPAGASVKQEHDDRDVAAGLEGLASKSGQQAPQAVFGDHRDGLLGDDRRLHARHRVGGDLVFLLEPAVQDAEHLVAGGDRPGGSTGEQLSQERLEVAAGGVEEGRP